MKNSTVNSGNSRSKSNSVGVGQPNNKRKSAIVRSMVSPASMPETNPQKIDFMRGREGGTVDLLISQFSQQVAEASPNILGMKWLVAPASLNSRKALPSIINPLRLL